MCNTLRNTVVLQQDVPTKMGCLCKNSCSVDKINKTADCRLSRLERKKKESFCFFSRVMIAL